MRKSAQLALVFCLATLGFQSVAGEASDFGAEPASYTIMGIIQEALDPFELHDAVGIVQEAPNPFEAAHTSIIDEAPDPFGIFIVTTLTGDSAIRGLLWRPWLSSWFLP